MGKMTKRIKYSDEDGDVPSESLEEIEANNPELEQDCKYIDKAYCNVVDSCQKDCLLYTRFSNNV